MNALRTVFPRNRLPTLAPFDLKATATYLGERAKPMLPRCERAERMCTAQSRRRAGHKECSSDLFSFAARRGGLADCDREGGEDARRSHEHGDGFLGKRRRRHDVDLNAELDIRFFNLHERDVALREVSTASASDTMSGEARGTHPLPRVPDSRLEPPIRPRLPHTRKDVLDRSMVVRLETEHFRLRSPH